MKNAIIVVVGLLIFGSIATYVRYESFSPCDWMEQDLQKQSGLPTIVVQGQIRADFLFQGIVDPGPKDCIFAWWKWRAAGGLKPQNKLEN